MSRNGVNNFFTRQILYVNIYLCVFRQKSFRDRLLTSHFSARIQYNFING